MSDVTAIVDRLLEARPLSAAADLMRDDIASAGLLLAVKRELQRRVQEARNDKDRLLAMVQHLLAVGSR